MNKKLMSKPQLREFIKENKLTSILDVQNALKELFAETLQEMLEAEMDETLHDMKNKQTSNSRNRKTRKRLTSVW